MRGSRGFTLVELLMVTVIMGILFSTPLVSGRYFSSREDHIKKIESRYNDIIISQGKDLYKLWHGSLPARDGILFEEGILIGKSK